MEKVMSRMVYLHPLLLTRCSLTIISADVPPLQVIVGPNGPKQQIFYIHHSMLKAHSDYFADVLTHPKANQRIKLPATSPYLFSTYVQWLYTGKIFGKPTLFDGDTDYGHLAELYGLGERLEDRELQNCIINAIVAGHREHIQAANPAAKACPTEAVDIAYNLTPPGSPARQMMIDLYVEQVTNAAMIMRCNFKHPAADAQFDFLKDVTSALLERRPFPPAEQRKEELQAGVPKSYHHGSSIASSKIKKEE
jgi:hypothetical protein